MTQNNPNNKPPANGKPRRTEVGGSRDLGAKPPVKGKPRRTEVGGTRDLNFAPEETEEPIPQQIISEIPPWDDDEE
jgi:hypothetical protein